MSESKFKVVLTAKQLEAVQIALHVRIDQCYSNGHRPYVVNSHDADDRKYWNDRMEWAESALEATRMTLTVE
jgi:hypothetical protein